MNKQAPLLLAAVAAALGYYFFKKHQGVASAARSAPGPGGGGAPITPLNAADYVPTSTRTIAPSGAPVPSLSTSLATASVGALGNILSALTSRLTGASTGTQGGGSSPALRSPTGIGTMASTAAARNHPLGTGPVQPAGGPTYGLWTDPNTGITYDLSSGQPVSGQDSGPNSVDLPSAQDWSNWEAAGGNSGGGNSVDLNPGSSDSSFNTQGDLGGGFGSGTDTGSVDSSGGGGGGDYQPLEDF